MTGAVSTTDLTIIIVNLFHSSSFYAIVIGWIGVG